MELQPAVLILLLSIFMNTKYIMCDLHYVISSSNHSCTNKDSCLTLSYFVGDSNLITSNTTLVFLGGNYALDSSMNVSDIEEFSMISNKNSTTIMCTSTAHFAFSNVFHVHISGLTFVGCSSRASFVDHLVVDDTISLGLNQSETFIIVNNSFAHVTKTFFSGGAGRLVSDDRYLAYLTLSSTTLTDYYFKVERMAVGGAVVIANSTLNIENSIFSNNSASMGGAIFSDLASTININNSEFMFNSAKFHHEKVCLGSGGVLFVGTESRVTVHNSTFYNNTSCGNGGVATLVIAILRLVQTFLYNNTAEEMGGVVASFQSSYLYVDTVYLSNNMASFGGGVFACIGSTTTMINSSNFINNSVQDTRELLQTQQLIPGLIADSISNHYIINGGVIYVENNSLLTVNESTFFGNSASGDGGVVHVEKHSSLVVSNCTIINNTAMSGGALYATESTNVLLSRNTFFKGNAAVYNGGVVSLDRSSSVIIEHSTAVNNVAQTDGGGVVFAQDNSTIELSYAAFMFNTVNTFGGVVRVLSGGTLSVYDCTFEGNSVKIHGGVFDFYYTTVIKIYHSSFTNNTARQKGGVLMITSEIRNGSTVDHDKVEITHSTFTNNSAQNGAVLFVQRSIDVTINSSNFNTNIAKSNGGTLYFLDKCFIVMFNSSFNENTAGNNGILRASFHCVLVIDFSWFSDNSVGFNGGALYILDGCNATITDCVFINNTASDSGGAVYGRKHSHIAMFNSGFHNNTALNSGGAVHAQRNSMVEINGASYFTRNAADYGGAVRVYDLSVASILTSTFQNNQALISGGAMAAYKESAIAVENSSFIHNSANVGGVAIVFHSQLHRHIFGSGSSHLAYGLESNVITISTCEFVNNSARYGGILYSEGSVLKVQSSKLDCNMASFSGGAIAALSRSRVVLNANVLSNNSASQGGLMFLIDGSSAKVNACIFTANHALSKGGDVFVRDSQVNISSSTFQSSFTERSNGGSLLASNSSLIIKHTLFIHNSASNKGGAVHIEWNTSLIVLYCNFTNNTAVQRSASGGALSVYKDSSVTIVCCKFEHNVAVYGGAIAANSSAHSIVLAEEKEQKCHEYGTQIENNAAHISGGGIYLCESVLYFSGNTIILKNQVNKNGGGIYAENSHINFDSNVQVISNIAKYGGGISLSNSNLHHDVHCNVTISLSFNEALKGGALYVDDHDCSSNNKNTPNGCFFQNVTKNLSLNFHNNLVNSTGIDLYGGQLDHCTIVVDVNHTLNGRSQWKEITNLTDLQTVSSDPAKVCYCGSEYNFTNCNDQMYSFQVKLGNTVTIPVVVIDQVNHPVTATVSSKINNASHIDNLLPESQALQFIGANCNNIQYSLPFHTAGATYTLTIGVKDTTCQDNEASNLVVEVKVVNCSCAPGFMPAHRMYRTECYCKCDTQDKTFSKYVQHCDEETESIVRQGVYWVTYIQDSDVNGYLFFPYCPHDYCHLPSESVYVNLNQLNGSDAQCVNHRTGILCGSCSHDYSLSLGSPKCIKCPGNWYGLNILIVLVTFFAGLALVFIILVFSVTVAVGTLNPIIFYANIIYANKSLYFGNLQFVVMQMITSWLNLDIGVDACFYEGMDTYAKIWLQLAFPAYIIVLVIVIILFSSFSPKFSNLIGKRDPVATLATLILLSYTKLLQLVISAFSYYVVNYPNGTATVIWVDDANIELGTGRSIALICVALLILVLGLVYTVILLCWQCLIKCPSVRLFKWTTNHKLYSFISTYHTPHRAKYRYWPGLLLLVRVLIYFVSAFSASSAKPVTLISTLVIMCCLLLHNTMIQVYKNWLLNLMESFVYLNIAVFAAFTLFTFKCNQGNGVNEALQRAVAILSVGSIVLLIMSIGMFHAYRYGNEKITKWFESTSLYNILKTYCKLHWGQSKDHNLEVTDNSWIESYRCSNISCQPLQEHPTSSIVTMSSAEEMSDSLITNSTHQTKGHGLKSQEEAFEMSSFLNKQQSQSIRSLSALKNPLLHERT